MNSKDRNTSALSIGGFPFADASVGVWMNAHNGDGFVPVPAVAYAGDMLFSAVARSIRRMVLSLMRYIESTLPEPVLLEEAPAEANAAATTPEPPLQAHESKAA